MEQKDLLLGHMEDLARKAVKTGCTASRFFTPAEAQSVAAHFAHRRDVALSFDGGYEGAERVRAVFMNSEWGKYDRAEFFTALKIGYRLQDTLGHRDILGALMALGVERDTIGDIVVVERREDFPDAQAIPDSAAGRCPVPAALVCLPELGGYMIENIIKIGRVGVGVSEIDLSEFPARTENLNIKTDTVASLRLDAVLCAAFGLSRTKAAELVSAGRVSLNHELCLQPAKELNEGALLSVRGLGRSKLLEAGGTSKKGRIFVRIGLYGR